MPNCSQFDCLDYSPPRCSQYVGCIGCEKFSDCSFCSNQAALVDKMALPCGLMADQKDFGSVQKEY